MARIEGICQCSEVDCKCNGAEATVWVDKITGKCRQCEIDHGERWGHHGTKALEATPGVGERNL